MNRRSRQFSLLIVRGDGVRMVRLNVPRPAVVGAGVALAVVVSVTAALVGDWIQLRQLTREAVTFHRQIQEQRATLDTFNRRLAEIRQEMSGWRDLHAKIWEPFGPELTPGGRDRGIGGGAPSPDRMPARLSPTDELNRMSESVKEQTESMRALERMMTRASRVITALPSRWPVRGAVNSEFGNRQSPWSTEREFHSGLDIRAGSGTPVHAPAAGSILHAGTAQEYGTTVILDHGQNIRTLYGHLSKLNVKPGQQVERGAIIGYTGNTGRSSGPHLHYEIHVKGQAVNPRAYLWD
ncbi:MAG TPA: M23 family metallopeptidase [Methylomirabilota bacterium]|nr:M23 family metallopeptidase [Methylomirabilota bacterium]